MKETKNISQTNSHFFTKIKFRKRTDQKNSSTEAPSTAL